MRCGPKHQVWLTTAIGQGAATGGERQARHNQLLHVHVDTAVGRENGGQLLAPKNSTANAGADASRRS